MQKLWLTAALALSMLCAIWLLLFGMPLLVYLFVGLAPGAVLIRKRMWHIGLSCLALSFLTPIVFSVGMAVSNYLSGSAMLGGSCHAIDRPERICFDEEFRTYRTQPMKGKERFDLWSEPMLSRFYDVLLETLISVLGPMKNSYLGPYVDREKALELMLNKGESIDLNELARVISDSDENKEFDFCAIFDFRSRDAQRRGRVTAVQVEERFEEECLTYYLWQEPKYTIKRGTEFTLFGISDVWIGVNRKREYRMVVLFSEEEGRVIDRFIYSPK